MNPHHPGHSTAYPHHPSLSSSPHHPGAGGPHHGGYGTPGGGNSGGGGGAGGASSGAGSNSTSTPDLPSPHSPLSHSGQGDPGTPYGSMSGTPGMGSNGHLHGGGGMMGDNPHHSVHTHPHLPGHPAYPPVNHNNNNCSLKHELVSVLQLSRVLFVGLHFLSAWYGGSATTIIEERKPVGGSIAKDISYSC
ncbi:hypothetical protein KQX54_007101 [Cotesia glomerata]|uniref:Uncharacterized protein n=1 Tax=Cotesia glomerata TaxID=32391 RepID=A0AAV7J5Y2_COTGL|nr:hypothetical protein KQX54_007101 [Cotesia glomerata]